MALLAVLALAGAGVVHVIGGAATDTVTTVPTTTVPAISSPYCRSDPHAGVHDPQRLVVMSPCVQVDGVVFPRAPELNTDGDVTWNLKPDPSQTWMMNAKNVSEGGLHIEVVPADQPGCTAAKLAKLTATLAAEGAKPNLGSCTGANVIFPPMNAHVRIIGPFVYDRWTSWNEIHPAWHVEILSPSGPPKPETHSYAASLSGSAVALHRGAPRGKGLVSLTLTDAKLCWRFSRLRRVGTPTHALLTNRAGTPKLSTSLGGVYRATGCTSVSTQVRGALLQRPRTLAVVLYTAKYRLGAVAGPLAPTSD